MRQRANGIKKNQTKPYIGQIPATCSVYSVCFAHFLPIQNSRRSDIPIHHNQRFRLERFGNGKCVYHIDEAFEKCSKSDLKCNIG